MARETGQAWRHPEHGSYLPHAVQLLGLPKQRYAEVVYLYLLGWSWAQIGSFLDIAPNTARNYMQAIRTWVGAKCAFEVVRIGYERLCVHLHRHGRLPTLNPPLAELAALRDDFSDGSHSEVRV